MIRTSYSPSRLFIHIFPIMMTNQGSEEEISFCRGHILLLRVEGMIVLCDGRRHSKSSCGRVEDMIWVIEYLCKFPLLSLLNNEVICNRIIKKISAEVSFQNIHARLIRKMNQISSSIILFLFNFWPAWILTSLMCLLCFLLHNMVKVLPNLETDKSCQLMI